MHFGQSTWRSRHLFLFRGSSTAGYVVLRLNKNIKNGCPAYKCQFLRCRHGALVPGNQPVVSAGADMSVGGSGWQGEMGWKFSFFIKTRYIKLALEIFSMCPSVSLPWWWTRLHTNLELSAWHIGVIRSFLFWCLHVTVFFRAWMLVIVDNYLELLDTKSQQPSSAVTSVYRRNTYCFECLTCFKWFFQLRWLSLFVVCFVKEARLIPCGYAQQEEGGWWQEETIWIWRNLVLRYPYDSLSIWLDFE